MFPYLDSWEGTARKLGSAEQLRNQQSPVFPPLSLFKTPSDIPYNLINVSLISAHGDEQSEIIIIVRVIVGSGSEFSFASCTKFHPYLNT